MSVAPAVQLVLGLAALAAAAWVVGLVLRRVAMTDDAAAAMHDALEDAEAEAERTEQAHARLPGATPERAIEVASAAAVEARAEAQPCPSCGGGCHVEAHVVQEHGAQRLRVAQMRCGRCGAQRSVYLRLSTPPLLN